MSVQQKFQIVSAGKVLRSRNPEDVLEQMASAFSITAQQARRLFLKGWVIKDELSSGQVVQYRTQLHQMGLKIEVHPAGKFDNRAILARMQFAQKRKARKDAVKPADANGAAPAVGNTGNHPGSSPGTNPGTKSSISPAAVKPHEPVAAPAVSGQGQQAATQKRKTSAAESAASSARRQLEDLFAHTETMRFESAPQRLALIPRLLSAMLVPALFVGVLGLCLVTLGTTLWSVPASILAGSASATAAVAGAAVKVLLLFLFAALFLYPYFAASKIAATSRAVGIRLRKADAPGLFLLLDVLEARTGLGIAGKLAGPRNLAAATQARGTLVEVTPGAEVLVCRSGGGQLTLSLGLATVASLKGGELLALVARALSYYQGALVRAASYCTLSTAQNLQTMLDALESERTILGADEPANPVLKPLHKLLSASGLALVPLVERLQALHRASSGALARRLEARADAAAAAIVGSEAFAQFAERWNQLVHADLVCGEINREAQLTGRRLANVPQGIGWLYRNLDEPTRASIELAMSEDTDCWSPQEPAGHERVAAVEDLSLSAALQRSDFSVQKLFVEFEELCVKSSRIGVDDSCRAVENRQLLTASKETEEAQRVLSEYFNRVIPRGLLPLQGPVNTELAELGLQEAIDWLRSRLVDLQEQEQRLAQLQLRGAAIQLGAALVRANVRVDPREYHLSGTTPSAAEASRKDNRARVQECMQQLEQLHRMFFLRIQGALTSMAAADRGAAEDALAQLQRFETLREPLNALGGCGDVMGELIERLPTAEVPSALLQKYAQLAVQQIRAVHVAVKEGTAGQPGLLSQTLMEKLQACAAAEPELPASSRTGDLVGALQELELRCKNACAYVYEGYQSALSRLLALCLEEESRRKIKPLRLVGSL